MTDKEKATPVTPEEADDIRVTLTLDDGEERECMIITILESDGQDYIALMPLEADGEVPEEAEVYLYRYAEDDEGLPIIDNIESDEEYEAVADRFDEFLDENMFDEMPD